MKTRQLRDLDLVELTKRGSDLKEELFSLRVQSVNGQLQNVKRVWAVKKEIARVQTLLRERQLATAQASER
ncbi:MAG: 50S ribosomal protein L29 [Deltaproteobacteria bacterium]|nr:50S ribosomal protein L29 [Deltaproteobacteria bacterium]